MNLKKNKILVLSLIFIMLVVLTGIFLTSARQNEKKVLENVNLNFNVDNNDSVAILVQTTNEDGSLSYVQSSSNTWPTGMSLNKKLSGCVDGYGETIENALVYDSVNNMINVEASSQAHCYLYFDVPSLESMCESGKSLGNDCLKSNRTNISSLSNDIIGGMYRFQGDLELDNNGRITKDIDNYICFGTVDKDYCITNHDKFMYRIIGVTEEGNLKLIKNEPLEGDGIQWINEYNYDEVLYGNSTLYSEINGDAFLNNTYFLPHDTFMWKDRIMGVNWKYGSTWTNSFSAEEFYEAENGFEESVDAKIGLMYIHDYKYSSTSLYDCGDASNPCSEISWMNLDANDLGNLSVNYEWVITSYGTESGDFLHFHIDNTSGIISEDILYGEPYGLVRPVFYISGNELYSSGKGTSDDPIMIQQTSGSDSANYLSEAIIASAGNGQVFNEGDAGYRFEGASVDNYVDFNNETWRIIGVEEGSKIGLTSGEYYTKIVVSEAMINMPYESSGYHGGDWSTTSSYYLLNDHYYNKTDGTNEMYCNLSGTCNFTTIGLTGDARSLVTSANYYYSQIDENASTTASGLYSQERNDSTKKVNAYVGIMYPSDYSFASLQSECSSVPHYSYPDNCSSINWLSTGYYEWSISPSTATSSSMYLFKDYDMSHIMPSDNIYEVRPVLYLDSTVKITGGNGTFGSHYQISK